MSATPTEAAAAVAAPATPPAEKSPAGRWDWEPFAWRFGPPAAAMALAWGLFSGVVLLHHYPYTASNFTKWDANLYAQIAQGGYELFPCQGSTEWGQMSWCGNTGWFPLYPVATRLVSFLVGSIPLAALLVTAVSFYSVLLLVWAWMLGEQPTIENMLLLALAAFFPGALYYIVPYPTPLFILLILLCFRALLSEHYALAGAFGALGAVSYSSAPALVITLGLSLLILNRRLPWRTQLIPLILTCGLTGLGYLLFLGYLQLSVGRWDANLLVLGKYGVGVYDPLATFLEKVVAMFRGEYRGREEFQGFQHLLCSALMLTFLVITTRDKERPPSKLEILCLVQGVTFWLFPMILGSSVLLWRAEALLLPTIVLAKRLSRASQAILLGLSIMLTGELTLQYFKNWLP